MGASLPQALASMQRALLEAYVEEAAAEVRIHSTLDLSLAYLRSSTFPVHSSADRGGLLQDGGMDLDSVRKYRAHSRPPTEHTCANPTEPAVDTNYDLSSFIRRGEGDLDGDVNIAKLALALEVDAAVGYVSDTTKLKSPEMIELAASMACVEAGHAARIRAALGNLGLAMPVIPSAVLRTSSRNKWIIKT